VKGPGLRVDLDVRRVWRCAKCGRVVRALGHVTAQRCGCTSDATQWMHLEPAVEKEPFRAPVREHLPEAWELEESAAAATPSPADADLPATPEPPVAALSAPSAEVPESTPAPAVVVETITIEIVEIVAEVPAPDAVVRSPDTLDTFGAGVDDAPQNPDGR
jgi:hypothetical protein